MRTVIEKVLLLQNVDLLSNASPEKALAPLASIAEEVSYAEGAIIFEEGETPEGLFVVMRGHVRLSKNGQEVALIGPKEALGAWSLFDEEESLVTVQATSETQLLKVGREDFQDLLYDYGEIGQSILKGLARHFRRRLEKVL